MVKRNTIPPKEEKVASELENSPDLKSLIRGAAGGRNEASDGKDRKKWVSIPARKAKTERKNPSHDLRTYQRHAPTYNYNGGQNL